MNKEINEKIPIIQRINQTIMKIDDVTEEDLLLRKKKRKEKLRQILEDNSKERNHNDRPISKQTELKSNSNQQSLVENQQSTTEHQIQINNSNVGETTSPDLVEEHHQNHQVSVRESNGSQNKSIDNPEKSNALLQSQIQSVNESQQEGVLEQQKEETKTESESDDQDILEDAPEGEEQEGGDHKKDNHRFEKFLATFKERHSISKTIKSLIQAKQVDEDDLESVDTLVDKSPQEIAENIVWRNRKAQQELSDLSLKKAEQIPLQVEGKIMHNLQKRFGKAFEEEMKTFKRTLLTHKETYFARLKDPIFRSQFKKVVDDLEANQSAIRADTIKLQDRTLNMAHLREWAEREEQNQVRLRADYKQKNREMMNLKLQIDSEKINSTGKNNNVEIDLIDYYINFNKKSLVRSKSHAHTKLPKITEFKSNNTILRSKNDIQALMHSTSVPLSKEFLLSLNDEEFQVLWAFIEQEKELQEQYDTIAKEKALILEKQASQIETSKMNFEIYSDCFKEYQRELIRHQSSSKTAGKGMKGSLLFEIKHSDFSSKKSAQLLRNFSGAHLDLNGEQKSKSHLSNALNNIIEANKQEHKRNQMSSLNLQQDQFQKFSTLQLVGLLSLREDVKTNLRNLFFNNKYTHSTQINDFDLDLNRKHQITTKKNNNEIDQNDKN